MKYKSKKILSSILIGTSIFSKIMCPISVKAVTNTDELWIRAYNATMVAKEDGLQEKIGYARNAIRELEQSLQEDVVLKDKLVGTLSSILDPIQEKLFIEFYNILYENGVINLKKRLTQLEINNARKLIYSFNTVIENQQYVPSWFNIIDKYQEKNIRDIREIFKKIEESYMEKDLIYAEELVEELCTVTNNLNVSILAQSFKLDISKFKNIFDKKKLEQEADKFKKKYNILLNTSIDKIKNEQKKEVLTAIEEYVQFERDIKELLKPEIKHLNNLKNKLEEQGKDPGEDPNTPTDPNIDNDKIQSFKELEELIKETKNLYDVAVESEYAYKNTYIMGSKNIFKSAIDKAEKVFVNKDNSKKVVDEANKDLNKAYEVFKNSLVKEVEIKDGNERNVKVGDTIEIYVDLNPDETIETDTLTLYDIKYISDDKYEYTSVGSIEVDGNKITVTCSKATSDQYGATFYIKFLNKDGISTRSSSMNILIMEN